MLNNALCGLFYELEGSSSIGMMNFFVKTDTARLQIREEFIELSIGEKQASNIFCVVFDNRLC